MPVADIDVCGKIVSSVTASVALDNLRYWCMNTYQDNSSWTIAPFPPSTIFPHPERGLG